MRVDVAECAGVKGDFGAIFARDVVAIQLSGYHTGPLVSGRLLHSAPLPVRIERLKKQERRRRILRRRLAVA